MKRAEITSLPSAVAHVAVVIPCFRVARQILTVIAAVGPEVTRIYVVDDRCPEGSGRRVQAECTDPRVRVLFHETNQGVGGAVISGYQAAMADAADIVVKIDGDGQMDPRLLPRFIAPLLDGRADYTKGNRFYHLESLSGMPTIRLFGNAILSFLSKIASGYWDLMDPSNGYTAIRGEVLRQLPLAKLDRRYFFESDMLFRLGTLRAVVADIAMNARYQDETSSLRIARVLREFPLKYLRSFAKRLFYVYFLRDFNACSVQLLLGSALAAFGFCFGAFEWSRSIASGVTATDGTVMLAALPIILGVQFLLAAASFDTANIPRQPIHPQLRDCGGAPPPPDSGARS